jgi:hypothetical protein
MSVSENTALRLRDESIRLLAEAETAAMCELLATVESEVGAISYAIFGAPVASGAEHRWEFSIVYDANGRCVEYERQASLNERLLGVLDLALEPICRELRASYTEFDELKLTVVDGQAVVIAQPVYDD